MFFFFFCNSYTIAVYSIVRGGFVSLIGPPLPAWLATAKVNSIGNNYPGAVRVRVENNFNFLIVIPLHGRFFRLPPCTRRSIGSETYRAINTYTLVPIQWSKSNTVLVPTCNWNPALSRLRTDRNIRNHRRGWHLLVFLFTICLQ